MKAAERSVAIASGEPRYSTGRACKKGHFSERFTRNGACCACEQERGQAWRAENPEKSRAASLRWREENPEKSKESSLRWRTENPSRRASAVRRWKQENPERVRGNFQKWKTENPGRLRELMRAANHRYRALHVGGVSGPEMAKWVSEQEKVCLWCGVACEEGFHVDHVTPLSKGGPHELWNLAVTCPRCNLRKNARHPVAFLLETIITPAEGEETRWTK